MLENNDQIKRKKNQIFIVHTGTGVIMPKQAKGGEAQLHGLAPGQHSSEETLQRQLIAGDTVPI